MYAVAMKNAYLAIGFGIITVSQFGLGVYMIVRAGKEGGEDWLLHPGSFPFKLLI